MVVGTTHGTLSRRGKSRIRGARPGTQTPTPRSPPLVERDRRRRRAQPRRCLH